MSHCFPDVSNLIKLISYCSGLQVDNVSFRNLLRNSEYCISRIMVSIKIDDNRRWLIESSDDHPTRSITVSVEYTVNRYKFLWLFPIARKSVIKILKIYRHAGLTSDRVSIYEDLIVGSANDMLCALHQELDAAYKATELVDRMRVQNALKGI